MMDLIWIPAYVTDPIKSKVHRILLFTDAEDLTINTRPCMEVSPANSANVFSATIFSHLYHLNSKWEQDLTKIVGAD